MNALTRHFHRSQQLLRGNTLSRQPVKGTVSVKVGPVELTSINAPTNAERLASYVAKRESARSAA
jgi:hypothetical protein